MKDDNSEKTCKKNYELGEEKCTKFKMATFQLGGANETLTLKVSGQTEGFSLVVLSLVVLRFFNKTLNKVKHKLNISQ